MSQSAISFPRYEVLGAYHWVQCDPSSPQFNPPLIARYKAVVSRVIDRKKVLDVGCGDGYLMNLLKDHAQKVYGIEPEPAGARLAGKLLQPFSNCTVLQGNCYTLPFADDSFDAVVCSDVIEHLTDVPKAISEQARVLAPEGTLVITTPKWRPDRWWDKEHVQEFKPDELKAHLQIYFDSVEIEYFWPLFWSNLYATRVGWKLLKYVARFFWNPFLKHSKTEEEFGQILAVCRRPKTPSPRTASPQN